MKQYVKRAIERIKRAEALSLRYSPDGFYVAFSGGKDSQCVYHLCKMAGVKFKAFYAVTTVDPPELVKFIKTNYPDVEMIRPKKTFYQLIMDKMMLPTQRARFCCAELKETNGAGRLTITGVRRAESSRRAKRNEIEVNGHKFSGSIDQFNETKESRIGCINGKEKVILNPIIDWSEAEVWDFLNSNGIEHCCLYDEGYTRLGCLFCPMSRYKVIMKDKARYPKHYKAILGTFRKTKERILANKGELKGIWKFEPEEIFDYWISKVGIAKWYADRKQQLKLFEDEETK